MTIFCSLAFIAGAAIATQAAMNAQLGSLLKSSLLATCIAFLMSWVFASCALIASSQSFPSIADFKLVPSYLWLSGLLSVLGVGLFYFLIPKMGAGSMMTFALAGQVLVALIISHYGWFDSAVKPIRFITLLGIVVLIVGVAMLSWDVNYES